VQGAIDTDNVRFVADAEGYEGADGIAFVQRHVHTHFAVHDANGKSLVIEFVEGKAKVTENPVGVLTNLPVFSWHITNLGLYAHLSNYSTHEAVEFGELKYAPPGSLSPEHSVTRPHIARPAFPAWGTAWPGFRAISAPLHASCGRPT
jgi:hypothetical protein